MAVFNKLLNRWQRATTCVLSALHAHPTGTENTTPIDTSEFSTLDLVLTTAAPSGTPSLAVAVQTGDLADGSDATTIASFAPKTTATTEQKRFNGLGRYTRVQAVLTGGTPAISYSVTGIGK